MVSRNIYFLKNFLSINKIINLPKTTTESKIREGIVDFAYGPHDLFFVGIGFMRYKSRFFLPDIIDFVGISFTKPIIK